MRYDSPRMERTFREEVIDARRRFCYRHRLLRVFGYPAYSLVLAVHRVVMFFWYHAKKFSGVALVAAAFAVSSSFAFPVLSMRAGFVSLDADRTALRASAAQTLSDTESGVIERLPEETDFRTDTEVSESLVDFAGEAADPEDLLDPTLLDEEYRYHSESGSDIEFGDTSTLEELLVSNDRAWARMDDGDGQTGFSADDWRLILVNKQHPIPEDYEFELSCFDGAMQCDSRIEGNLLEMFRGAMLDGVTLIPCSPYRTHDHQVELFDRKIDRYMSAGLSYMDAYSRASQAVTVPGTSEHEIGLAIDLVTSGYTSLNEGFGQTEAGQWLAEHSAEYGFIVRYPAGKENITGIEYEPWHMRYVGREAAEQIVADGICLEEFWDRYLYH